MVVSVGLDCEPPVGMAPVVRMVLVGSGPSAPQYAAEIDKCDIVVRMNAFPFGETGNRWTIWSTFLAGRGHRRAMARWNLPKMVAETPISDLIVDEKLPREIWLMVPPGKLAPNRKSGRPPVCSGDERKWLDMMNQGAWENADDWAKAQRAQAFKHTGASKIPITRIPLDAWERLDKHVRRPAGTGLRSIAIALEREPKELVIVGFDATAVKEPGWGHWNPGFQGEWAPGAKYHDWAGEQKILSEWVESRTFCGKEYPKTRPVWWKLK